MPQTIAGTMVRNEAMTAKAIAGCRPIVDFHVPIPDWGFSVIERILIRLEIANCQSVAIRLATGTVEGERESWEVNYFRIGPMLVSEHRQSTNVSSRVWYRAEVRVAVHDADFSGTKSPCARL